MSKLDRESKMVIAENGSTGPIYLKGLGKLFATAVIGFLFTILSAVIIFGARQMWESGTWRTGADERLASYKVLTQELSADLKLISAENARLNGQIVATRVELLDAIQRANAEFVRRADWESRRNSTDDRLSRIEQRLEQLQESLKKP